MRRSASVLLILALSGCKCGSNAVVFAGPHANVTPQVLDFGDVRVDSRVEKHIVILNDGRQQLNVRPTLDASSDTAFSVDFADGEMLTAGSGETIDLTVRFQPGKPGKATGKVSLDTNSEGSPQLSVALTANAVTSTLQICRVDSATSEDCEDPLTVDFGLLHPGQGAAHQLVLRAKGDASIHIARVALTPSSDPGYSLSGLPAMPYELPVGTDVKFTASWTAVNGGPSPGAIEFLSDSDGAPRKLVSLTAHGDAPRLCIDAAELDFGQVQVSQTGRHTAHLLSCGTQPLTINGASTAAPFAIDGTPPAWPQTLQPGDMLPLALSFAPTDTGLQFGQLDFDTNELHPSHFPLVGEGVQCILDLAPGTLDFGQVSTSNKASKTFYLRSVGYSDCTVTSLGAPSGTAGFAMPSPPPMPLAMPVGLEVPVDVDFQPAAQGGASATIEVDSDDSTAPVQHEHLTATGIAPPPCDFVAQPVSVQFGAVDVGKLATSNVVVTNKGAADCYITGGGASGDASFSAPMPGGFPPPTVASGANVTIPVTYSPSSSALHLGTLTVEYSDQEVLGNKKTLTVPLQGGTLLPKMCLSPTLLDFGAVSAGAKSVKSFVISSCGDGTLTVRGLSAAAGTSSEFSIPSRPALPLALPKGSSATINVQYEPRSASAAAGSIEVLDNDPAQLKGKVDLRGNLGPCATQLVCSPSSVTFGGTQVGRTSAQPVTCTNTGNAVTVSSVTASAGSDPDVSMQAGRLPITLQSGDTLRAEVQFAPTAAAAGVATFTFNTGGCGDAKVDVTAIGLAPDYPHCPSVTAFTPKVKWAWNGGNVMTDWSNVEMTPVVAPLSDTNADGKIDENDVPAVVFASCSTASCCVNCADPQHIENADLSGDAVLRAVSGKDASALWTASDAALHVPSGSMIAAADIDGDGVPEIIAVQHSFRPGQTCPGQPVDSLPMCFKYIAGSLLALDHTGKLLWVSEQWAQPPTVVENDSSLLVADLDQDGYPEIVFGDTVFDSTGHALWHMSATVGNTGHGTYAAAADVDGDGKLELLAGPTAYKADGSVLWTNAHVDDGIVLVGDVDGDGKPDVLVRPSASHVVVLEGATGAIKRDIQLPLGKDQGGVDTSACPAGPSMGDFLGNGKMQLALPAGNWFYLIDAAAGTVLWQKPIEDYDGQCGASGAAVFSFFGDGKADIVYHDSQNIWVWRGDGTQVYNSPRTSSTLFETPVIADVDNDGHAEVLITNQGLGGTNNGLEALGDSGDSWPATRRVWSQWNYHVTDANENGTVPRVEQPFWKTSRLWRGNPPLCTK